MKKKVSYCDVELPDGSYCREIAENCHHRKSASYARLLKNAPPHDSPEFLEYLRKNNHVVREDGTMLIIENAKYHAMNKPWYTVFFKCFHFPTCTCAPRTWDYLLEEYGDWEWLKKAAPKQTVKRFHIHLIHP